LCRYAAELIDAVKETWLTLPAPDYEAEAGLPLFTTLLLCVKTRFT
jgi:hypothetical protein